MASILSRPQCVIHHQPNDAKWWPRHYVRNHSGCLTKLPLQQGSWGQHGVHLGPTGPRWAPCWPHELCYLGYSWPAHDASFLCTSLFLYHTAYITHWSPGSDRPYSQPNFVVSFKKWVRQVVSEITQILTWINDDIVPWINVCVARGTGIALPSNRFWCQNFNLDG